MTRTSRRCRRGDRDAQDRIKLVSLSIIAGTHGPQRATMKLNIDGRTAIEECEGNGPVDATSTASRPWCRTTRRWNSTRCMR